MRHGRGVRCRDGANGGPGHVPRTEIERNGILLLGGLALLALAVTMVLIGTDGVSAACSPPASGDWTVVNGDVCTHSSTTLTLDGDLRIRNGGNLTLDDVLLQVSSSSAGEHMIEVQNGGVLNVRSGSNITSTNPNYEYGFVVKAGATVDIRDSTVRECGHGPGNEDAVGLRIESDSVTIKRSTFRDNYVGVFVKASSPTVDNTTFMDNRFGILCTAASSPELYDNRISQNTDGVYCMDSSPVIINNEIFSNEESAVYLKASDAEVRENDLHDNAYGVGMLSSSPEVRDNKIRSNRDGIRAYFGAPLIESNDIWTNDRYAAYMVHTGGEIENNDIMGPLTWSKYIGYGILLHGARTTVGNNSITDVNLTALAIEADSDVMITGNDILRTDAYGVDILTSRVNFVGNNISHSYYGMTFTTSNGTVSDNMFYDNRIAVDGYFVGASMRLLNNTFLDNYRRGVSLYDSHPLIQDNTFNNNIRAIRCYDSDPTVIGNTFMNNSFGIDISKHSDITFSDNLVMHGNYTVFSNEARATLINNTIKFSANYSVYLENGSYAELVGNDISGNDRKGIYIIESGAQLVNNTIHRSGTGVYARNGILEMEDNHIFRTGVGVFVNDTELSMLNDTFERCSVFGLVASENTVTIKGVVMNNTADGLYFTNLDMSIDGLEVYNGTKGLSVYYAPPFRITNSAFGHFDEEGIYLDHAEARVTGSRIEDCQYGIRALDSPLFVSGSEFYMGEDGIYAEDTTVSVKASRIEALNNTGINAVESTLTVDGTDLAGNRNGMFLENVTVTVTDSFVESNTDMGIRLNESTLVTRDTRYISNMDGIFDLGMSSIDIWDCNISSNEVYGLFTDDSTVRSDIHITRKMFLVDNLFLLRGQLTIHDGGHGMFIRSPIEYYSLAPGETGTLVETGGRMAVLDTIMFSHVHDEKNDNVIGYTFMAQNGSGLTIANSTVRHCGRGGSGLQSGLVVGTEHADVRDTLFQNNSVGLYVYATSFRGRALRFEGNRIGLMANDAMVDLVNSSVHDSREKDLHLTFSTVTLLNTNISYSKAEVSDGSSILIAKWYLHVSVTWNDGQPVEDAQITVEDRGGRTVARSADRQGWARWMVVREYQQKGPSEAGYFAFSPLVINATEKGLSVERTEYVSATTTVNIVMTDDSPPVLEIVSPEQGEILYDRRVLMTGKASDMASSLASVKVSVDGKTWVDTNGTGQWYVNITVPEGEHVLMARAIDTRGNTGTANVSIEVDLSSPMLEIHSPSDGLVTNSSVVTVRGRVHVGSGLIIKNMSVPVDDNGTFSWPVGLEEGQNPINIKAIKGLEEMTKALIVTMDTGIPHLDLVHPSPALVVNHSEVTVTVASNEVVTIYVDDEEVPTYGGVADVLKELEEGVNVITVRAVDLAGNVNTTDFTITVDLTPPPLNVEKPVKPVLKTSRERIKVMGTTEPGVNLTIDGETVEVGPDGNFSVKYKLRMGNNTIDIISRDEANNTNRLVLEVEREQVEDYSGYIWLVVLAVLVGVVADVATVYHFTRIRPSRSLEAEEEGAPPIEGGVEAREPGAERRYPRRSSERERYTGPETGAGTGVAEDETEFEEVEFEELELEEF